MHQESHGLIGTLLDLPIFQAEWVLWLLIGLSIASLAVIIERLVFYRRHRLNIDEVQTGLTRHLDQGDLQGAADYLSQYDTLETNVVLHGLKDHRLGPESVEDLISSAARKERGRFEKRLNFLATVASNAPFIGLFGTVLGIIRAFKDLAGNMNETSDAVMAGIAEALIATAVGLLVAIPAVIAFNAFKSRVNALADNMHLLAGTLLANFKADIHTAQPVPVKDDEV
ncbi:MAG: MotA/TolQ/ExbB proton channel family protein [Myxococcota bacterium]|nr:MotA/TolQ/ExbB proton channel family protein [Myxococcota bacterium]